MPKNSHHQRRPYLLTLLGVLILSAAINLLYLTGPVFMLEVYDRVLASHSLPTLAALCSIAGFLYAVLGFFDAVRARLLVRLSSLYDESFAAPVLRAMMRQPLAGSPPIDRTEALRHLDGVRVFLTGVGPSALC